MGNKQNVPLVPTDAALKEKRFSGRVSRWVWRSFTSSARTDGLELSHWVQATDKATDYKFARFNKGAKVPVYTDDEYEQHLKGAPGARCAAGPATRERSAAPGGGATGVGLRGGE